jgi:ferredoxin-NADP reductase
MTGPSDGPGFADRLEASSALDRPIWDSAVDGVLICRAIFAETHDVKTFVFSAPAPARFVFEPGQFLTFTFRIDGEEVQRCYTISSSAAVDATVSITTKRTPNGRVSPWMHANLRVGDAVRAAGPNGAFTPLASNASEKYIMLSGGSGITPLVSMARTFADLADDRDILFVHAARTPRDLILRDELKRLARRMPRLRIVYVVESNDGEPGWPGPIGRIDAPFLNLVAPDLKSRMAMCCGPALFMAAMKRLTSEAGLPGEKYAQESFDFAALDEEPAQISPIALPIAAQQRVHEITFARLRRGFPCPSEMTILEAARKAGVPLAFGCAKGVCGTCKSKKLSGSVNMKHGGGIRQREIDQGFILPCCSRPLADVSLDR